MSVVNVYVYRKDDKEQEGIKNLLTKELILKLNRELSAEEQTSFYFHTECFNSLYGESDFVGDKIKPKFPAFDMIETDMDEGEFRVHFKEELKVSEAARISQLLNNYFEEFTKCLFVNQVYALIEAN